LIRCIELRKSNIKNSRGSGIVRECQSSIECQICKEEKPSIVARKEEFNIQKKECKLLLKY